MLLPVVVAPSTSCVEIPVPADGLAEISLLLAALYEAVLVTSVEELDRGLGAHWQISTAMAWMT